MNLSRAQRLLLLGIVVLGLGLRAWQLSEVPPGLFYDEAVNANQAYRIARTGDFRAYYPENFGREGLYVNLLAVTFSLFGPGLTSLRLVGATGGILTIPLLVWFTEEWWKGTFGKSKAAPVALWSGFFLATSFWHVLLSRVAFRAVLLPPFMLLTLGFLLRTLRTRSVVDYIGAGLAMGVGLQTYTAFPLITVPAAPLLWSNLREAWQQSRVGEFLAKVLLFVVVCLVASLPLWLSVLENPREATVRSYQVSVLNHPHPWRALGDSLVSHLGMFHVRGDPLWRHNLGGAPQLVWPVGLLFLIGLFTLLRRDKTSCIRPAAGASARIFLPIVGLLAFLTAGILTHQNVPHALRTAGTIPFVYLLAGVGALRTLAWFNARVSVLADRVPRPKAVAGTLLAVVLTAVTGVFYFGIWANHPETREAYLHSYTQVGRFLNRLPPSRRKVILTPSRFAAEIPRFYENTLPPRNHATIYVSRDYLEEVSLQPGDVVIDMEPASGALKQIQQRHPNGRRVEHGGFVHYEIPGFRQ